MGSRSGKNTDRCGLDSNMTEQFISNGFLVETPPPLLERFIAPWSDEYSLPYIEDGELRCKPIVFYDFEKKFWGIKFKGVYNSEFWQNFTSASAANEFVRHVLRSKPN